MRCMVVKVVAILMMIGLLAAGCATAEVGRKFDTEAADRIEIGKTTEAEVLAWLGEPLQKTIMPNNQKIFVYNYIKSQGRVGLLGPNIQSQGNQVTILFDKNGVVASITKGSMPGTVGPGRGEQ